MTGGIFISYRRGDNRYAAGRLYDSLHQRFPGDQIFIDVDNIEPGVDFLKVIQEKVAASDAMLVVIGPNWLDVDGQRRLDDPHDFVRLEIEAALKRDIRVIPVLVEGAEMPKADDLPEPLRPLIFRNAVRMTHATFKHDAERLGNAIRKVVQADIAPPFPTSKSAQPTRSGFRSLWPWYWSAGFVVFSAAAITSIVSSMGPGDSLLGARADVVVYTLMVVTAIVVVIEAWRYLQRRASRTGNTNPR